MADGKTETPTLEKRPRPPPAIQAPIELLRTTASRVYTHVHPVLVLGLYYSSFKATVEDPVSSLTNLLPRLCLLQLLYALLCLPTSTASKTQSSTPSKTPVQPQRRKNATTGSNSSLSSKIIPAFLSLAVALLAGSPVITTILILHGASLNTHLLRTLLAGAHLSILATTSLFYAHGVNGDRWRELCGFMAPIDDVYGAAIGTFAGAWLGAIPIPLDWDREWQKWPVTIVTGAYMGWAVGKLVGGTVLKGLWFAAEDYEDDDQDDMLLEVEAD